MNVDANFELVASESAETSGSQENSGTEMDRRQDKFKKFVHIYSLKKAKLLELGAQYPLYRRFLMIRAAHRKSYFMKVLAEVSHQIELNNKT